MSRSSVPSHPVSCLRVGLSSPVPACLPACLSVYTIYSDFNPITWYLFDLCMKSIGVQGCGYITLAAGCLMNDLH